VELVTIQRPGNETLDHMLKTQLERDTVLGGFRTAHTHTQRN